jgi:prolyl-tRNA synthetase
MRQSHLFTKTRKEAPSDETSKNAELLIRAGFIHKEMAGVYAFLPLGLRTLNNIISIIREEMNAIGGQEISMTALQDKAVWEQTERWSDDVVDVWFKTKLKNETVLGLGVTHEEPITAMMKNFVRSYKELPRYVYQFQTKFRNETRAKSGIMRTREFIMKDLYSFCTSQEAQETYYEKVKNAYVQIFNRLGIGNMTYVTFASGGIFSKYSHEFQTICDAGEDEIYIHDGKKIAINKEVLVDEVLADLGVAMSDLRVAKASEVGNIFNLGTRFSGALDLYYQDEQGQKQSVWMGSYGIGPARVMGVIAEVLADDKGLVWPEAVAPFSLHLLTLAKNKDTDAYKQAEELYSTLTKRGVEVLFDDRDLSAGEKFADSDLIGIPMRVVVSEKSLAQGGVELKERKGGESSIITTEELLATFKGNCE